MSSDSREARCPLLELPTEVRCSIWHQLMSPPPVICYYHVYGNKLGVEYDKLQSAILSTCKTIQNEMQPIMASSTVLEIKADWLKGIHVPAAVQMVYFSAIRHLRVRMILEPSHLRFEPKQLPRLEILEVLIQDGPKQDGPYVDGFKIRLRDEVAAKTKDRLWRKLSGARDKSIIDEWLQAVRESETEQRRIARNRRQIRGQWLYEQLMPDPARKYKIRVSRPWSLKAHVRRTQAAYAYVILELTFDVDTRQIWHRRLKYNEVVKRGDDEGNPAYIDKEDDLILQKS